MEDEFDEFKRELINKSILFEDVDFPATNASLYLRRKPTWNNVWRRPIEVDMSAVFMASDHQIRLQIKQGPFHNASMVGALSAVVPNTELFRHVVPPAQSFTHLYAGIFRFRFWSFGSWIEIRVDDRLPYNEDTGKFMTLMSVEKHEFWVALVEKACAKFYGSYESTELCLIGEIMEDMSGGISESFNLSGFHSQLDELLFKAYDRQSLITLTISSTEEVAGGHLGLVGGGRSYSVSKILRVETKPMSVVLLRLHSAWSSNEWRGAWSITSPMWKSLSAFMKRDLGITLDQERDFFISYEDIVKYFTYLDISNIPSDPGWFDAYGRLHWSYYRFFDRWEHNTSGGGQMNENTFCRNPQYRMVLSEADSTRDLSCTVRVALLQRTGKDKHARKFTSIGFSVYYIQHPELYPKRLTKEFLSSEVPLMMSGFFKVRQVMRRLILQPGAYCVIPSTEHSFRTGEFLLRFLTEKNQVIYPSDGFQDIEDSAQPHQMLSNPSHTSTHESRRSRHVETGGRNHVAYIVLFHVFAVILVAWTIKHFFGDIKSFVRYLSQIFNSNPSKISEESSSALQPSSSKTMTTTTTTTTRPSPSSIRVFTSRPPLSRHYTEIIKTKREWSTTRSTVPGRQFQKSEEHYKQRWWVEAKSKLSLELDKFRGKKKKNRFWWEDWCNIT